MGFVDAIFVLVWFAVIVGIPAMLFWQPLEPKPAHLRRQCAPQSQTADKAEQGNDATAQALHHDTMWVCSHRHPRR